MTFESEAFPRHPRARNVTAVLGPTNTGKTHLAVERMLGHETGMIGLPLRLLAREVYDRVAATRGPDSVALITGEERIVPAEPRYYVCTVEAMPADVAVDFVAIDEVQLAADFERGHVFTDRLLHRRGNSETMLLGAATMRTLIGQLLPGAHFVSRPRFSRLTYSGQKKLTRLPPRSAIVCFNADSLYEIAELIRRQRGGAAVVMGALSPRTRNAQVELFQSGQVDFLVATDAIGMGLNMDVNHVAFAATAKFDGRGVRQLTAPELAQIAGRAGRHMNDGTFGVTGDAAPFDAETIERIENHNFDPVRVIQWRNRNLDFSSLSSLQDSLARPPREPGLTRVPTASDMEALELLSHDPEIHALAASPEAVRLVWDVCQIPDYRNITGSDHAALVGQIVRFLCGSPGVIPEDWFQRQVAYADRVEGDIDTLSNRIAHIRTWTYIANRPGWLDDAQGWQQRTRDIEDRLSDALHEQLTQRFVDRRTSVLMRRLREKENLTPEISHTGDIHLEGEFVGHLKGFHFVPDSAGEGAHGRAVRAASLKAVAAEIASRAGSVTRSPDRDFSLRDDAVIVWQGAPIARLKGSGTGEALQARVQLIADDQLEGDHRTAVQGRLETWVERQISTHLLPLMELARAEDITGLARGMAFRLVESLGSIPREKIAEDVQALDQAARGSLRRHGVKFGAFHVFVPVLLKPAAAKLKLILWTLLEEEKGTCSFDRLPPVPSQGETSIPTDPDAPDGFYEIIGYRACGKRAVRIDMLERLADLIRPKVFWKPQKEGDERPEGSVEGGGFTVTADMMSLIGCSGEEFADVLRTLGFRSQQRPVKAEVSEGDAAESAQVVEVWLPKSVRSRADKRQHAGGRKGARNGQDRAGAKTAPAGEPRRDGRRRRPAGETAKGAPAKRTPRREWRDREAAVDPNSPFAALEALKAQLVEKEKAGS